MTSKNHGGHNLLFRSVFIEAMATIISFVSKNTNNIINQLQ
jgi:hypothetical protein